LSKLDGVHKVDVSLKSNTATVVMAANSHLTQEQVSTALAGKGFGVKFFGPKG